MARNAILIIQVPQGSAPERQLHEQPRRARSVPASSSPRTLEPPAAGDVVLSVPATEALRAG